MIHPLFRKLKLIIYSIMLLTLSSLALFAAEPRNSEELFKKMKASYQKNFPKDFVSTISGSEINRSVKEIPRDDYCKGKKPRVLYLFIKNVEESDAIIIENVKEPHTTIFQMHLSAYSKIKAFLDYSDSYSALKRKYDWVYVPSESSRYYVVKMVKKIARKDNIVKLYIDKKRYNIVKAVQFRKSRQVGTVKISYKSIQGYYLPVKLQFQNVRLKDRRKSFTLKMSNYKLNVGLTDDIVIDLLQNDCPSLRGKHNIPY